MRHYNPNRLLVEGSDDKRVIPELIEAMDGVDQLLEPGVIETEVKASGLEALGIVVDADSDGAAQWQRIRARCLPSFPNLPRELPADGLVHANQAGLRLGVWIMPDNMLGGMLETFLAYLVPDQRKDVWAYACEAVARARAIGAPIREAHLDKARIHTWLAWQEPPGGQLHHAILQRILDPKAPSAKPFIDWFRRLYRV